MRKVSKLFMAASLAAIMIVTTTGCGETRTVFDDIEEIGKITEGKFDFDLAVNGLNEVESDEKEVLSAKIKAVGGFNEDSFYITLPSITYTQNDTTYAFENIAFQLVDSKIYVPIETINNIYKVVSGTDMPEMKDKEGNAFSWISIDVVQAVESQTAVEVSDINNEEIKTYMATVVLPELKDGFGKLENKILFVDSGKAHFKLTKETLQEFVDTLKVFIQDGSLMNIVNGVEGLVGVSSEEVQDLDIENVVAQLDAIMGSIPEETRFSVDLSTTSNAVKGTIELDGEVTDTNSTVTVEMNMGINKETISIEAPLDGVCDLYELMGMTNTTIE